MNITFPRVMAYKVTYHTACTFFMINTAYDKLVDLGRSDWLEAIEKNVEGQGEKAEGLRHFMVYFDDGPCYEFIGTSFSVDSNFPATIPPEPWLNEGK